MTEASFTEPSLKQKLRLNWRYYLGTALQIAAVVMVIGIIGAAFGYAVGYNAGLADGFHNGFYEGYLQGWEDGIAKYIEQWTPP